MSKICFDCQICIFCIVPSFYKGRVANRGRDRQKNGTDVRYGTVPVPYGRNVRYRNRAVRYGTVPFYFWCSTVLYWYYAVR